MDKCFVGSVVQGAGGETKIKGLISYIMLMYNISYFLISFVYKNGESVGFVSGETIVRGKHQVTSKGSDSSLVPISHILIYMPILVHMNVTYAMNLLMVWEVENIYSKTKIVFSDWQF